MKSSQRCKDPAICLSASPARDRWYVPSETPQLFESPGVSNAVQGSLARKFSLRRLLVLPASEQGRNAVRTTPQKLFETSSWNRKCRTAEGGEKSCWWGGGRKRRLLSALCKGSRSLTCPPGRRSLHGLPHVCVFLGESLSGACLGDADPGFLMTCSLLRVGHLSCLHPSQCQQPTGAG